MARSLFEQDDERLVRSFRASGDNALFAEIFRRHSRSVYYACRNVVRDPAAAEDLTQETFMRAYEHINYYVEGNFEAWLKQIARNLSINWLRSPRNRQISGLDEIREEPCVGTQHITQALELETAFKKLSPHQRRAIKLFYFDGLSYGQIAATMTASNRAITSNLKNGMRLLRRHFERMGDEGRAAPQSRSSR